MGTGRFSRRFVAAAALLLGGLGCEDRARPEFAGVGNGIGPLSLVTAPDELDTVQLDTDFFLTVRVEDEDGVDSVWVTFNTDEVAPLAPFSGGGQDVSTAGFSVLLPATLSVDTLVVSVQGTDLLSDTGVVFQRHLIVQ